MKKATGLFALIALSVLAFAACARSEATLPNRLAFTLQEKGQWDIYTADVQGNDLRRLTNTLERETDPIWSHDGKRLAFSQGEVDGTRTMVGGGGLFVVNYDGSDLRQLAQGPVFQWSWSPDSTMLVYSTLEAEEDCFFTKVGVHVVEVDSGKKLATIPDAYYPVWLPSGDEIVFVHADHENGQYSPVVVAAKTGEVRSLKLSEPDGLELWPIASNASRDIVLWVGLAQDSDDRPEDTWLWTTSSKGEGLTKTAKLAGAPNEYTYKFFMFASEYAGCSLPYEFFRAWSPEGSKVAVLTMGDEDVRSSEDGEAAKRVGIGILDLTGRRDTSKTVPFSLLVDDWDYETSIVNLGWSRDGDRLLYALVKESADRQHDSSSEWRFSWYNLAVGDSGEILPGKDPTKKAYLSCCGLPFRNGAP